ncbi:MAG: nuclear transport factor 2 family protein [Chitinophagaceae bacterium]|nr:nuclear transport factor 2 family protein [Chitinophagaceae bacterium]
MKKIFLGAVVSLCVTIIATAQSKQETALANAVEKLRKAMIDGDKTALEEMVADKLSYGHSGGHIDDKKEFVDKLASGKSDFVTIDLTEQTISISGKTAIVRHKLSATTNDGGKLGEVHLHVMLVWQKQGGKWILLARQAVKIA